MAGGPGLVDWPDRHGRGVALPPSARCEVKGPVTGRSASWGLQTYRPKNANRGDGTGTCPWPAPGRAPRAPIVRVPRAHFLKEDAGGRPRPAVRQGERVEVRSPRRRARAGWAPGGAAAGCREVGRHRVRDDLGPGLTRAITLVVRLAGERGPRGVDPPRARGWAPGDVGGRCPAWGGVNYRLVIGRTFHLDNVPRALTSSSFVVGHTARGGSVRNTSTSVGITPAATA